MNWPAFLAIVCCIVFLATPLERDRFRPRRSFTSSLGEPKAFEPRAQGSVSPAVSAGEPASPSGSTAGVPHLAVDAPALHPPDPPGRGSGHPSKKRRLVL